MTETALETLSEYLPALFEKGFQQIYLASLSTLAAILIGVPLGILVTVRPKAKNLVMGAVNIFQTIPSIAMLAFLIPFLGIGVKPALVTLALYAILPIVRNTHAGLENVPGDLIEAADGIGFTPSQKLWMVEFPIALPLIIAGIRTAAVMSVGIATVAAFIGAGGLGDFIFQGISTNNTTLVLLGAIPAAFLALLMDFLFGRLERFFSLSSRAVQKLTSFKVVCLSLIILFFVGMATLYPNKVYFWKTARKNEIIVATKDFTEQYILGELIAQRLEKSNEFKVVRKFNLGSTDVCQQAMVKGEIDIYPEYTGTAYLVVLKEKFSPEMSPEEQFQYVNLQYQKRFHIKWLEPFGFNNTQALAVKEAFARENALENLTELTSLDQNLIIAAPPEFLSRPDAYAALKKGYGLEFKEVRQMAPALLYRAIASNDVNVIMAFSTDGLVEAYNLVILDDNKHVFPQYQASILIREEILKLHPDAASLLAPLSKLIDNEQMRKMNYQVEIEKNSPSKVARTFLKEHNLL